MPDLVILGHSAMEEAILTDVELETLQTLVPVAHCSHNK